MIDLDELVDLLTRYIEDQTRPLADDDYVEVMQRLAENTSLAAEVKQEEMDDGD